MSKIIYKKRGSFCFEDEGTTYRCATMEEALEAGGVEEKVAVSGVPYKVDSSDVEVGTKDE